MRYLLDWGRRLRQVQKFMFREKQEKNSFFSFINGKFSHFSKLLTADCLPASKMDYLESNVPTSS